MPIEIRKADADDIPALAGIDTTVPVDPNRARYIERMVRAGQTWVAAENERIEGYAVLNQSFFSRPTIDMLMVSAERRRTGIGLHLIKSLEEHVSYGELWTSTNASNLPMLRLLSRLGYILTGYVSNLDPDDTELIFYKSLTVADKSVT